jgi:hypothetical protein
MAAMLGTGVLQNVPMPAQDLRQRSPDAKYLRLGEPTETRD